MRRIIPFFIMMNAFFMHTTSHAADPKAVFEIMALTLDDGTMGIAKCNTETGEGWYKDGQKWSKGVDDAQVPNSLYHCHAQKFKDKGWLFIRMDVTNGDTWTLEGNHWKKVEN